MAEPIDRRSDINAFTHGGGQTRQGDIKSVRAEVISTADDKVNIAEPSTPTHSEYPNNKAEQTTSGHLFEVDDTPGAERILEMHKSGTFYEIHPDGKKVTKIFGDDFYIVLDDHNLVVGGNINITVQGNANLLVKGDMKTKVGGNYDLVVHGNMKTRVHGTETHYSKGNMSIQTNANLSVRSQQTTSIQSEGNMTLRTSSIFRAWADARMFLDGSRTDINLPGENPAKVSNADPGGGLTIADSVIEPSFDTMKVVRTDNPSVGSAINQEMLYPKDRTKHD